jgi:hypothetical protein
MNCKEIEKNIYLYDELTASEKTIVDEHTQQCAACKKLLEVVLLHQAAIHSLAHHKPQPENYSKLTSNIMQAVSDRQKQSVFWINSLVFKYSMAAASFALIVAFGVEQLRANGIPYKEFPSAKTVTLTSASFSKSLLERKEKNEVSKTSLYACVKSGDCDNPLSKR